MYILLLVIILLIFLKGMYNGLHSFLYGISPGYNYDVKIYGFSALKMAINRYSIYVFPLLFIMIAISFSLIIYEMIHFRKKSDFEKQTKKKIIHYIVLLMVITPIIMYILFINEVMLIYKVNILLGTIILLYGRIKYQNDKLLLKLSKYLLLELIIITLFIVCMYMI